MFPKFRNANGVQLKLLNFKAIENPGTGMSSYSREDENVFKEFNSDRDKLKQIATQIRAVTVHENYNDEISNVEDEWDCDGMSHPEGEVLYKLHKVRERNKNIVKRKKDQALRKYNVLRCEACGFIYKDKYQIEQNQYIECHHIKPLHLSNVNQNAKVEDLVLLCSNCHIMIHRSKIYDIEEFIR